MIKTGSQKPHSLIALALGIAFPARVANIKASMAVANVFRALFSVMTFLAIGLLSNFRKLCQEGSAKPAGVYVLCLFGYIIWVGLLIPWLFFHGGYAAGGGGEI
jgi:hypothetical protein